MTKITLALLLGLSIFVSVPVQAGGRNAHHDNHQYQLCNKHHRHHNKHNRHHNRHHRQSYARDHQGYRGGHVRHERHGRYTRSYPEPRFLPGPRYATSGGEFVIVYQPRVEGRIRY